MGTYKTSDFKKGLRIQIDGEPYMMVEMNFRKPGKGNALYECKMKNLVRGTTLTRTYKGGDSLESADVEETQCQYLYRQGETFVFMDNSNFEQHEVPIEMLNDKEGFLKEGLLCNVTFFNGRPIVVDPPSHVELKVEYCDPGARGDTATNVTKPVKLETGAEIQAPIFIQIGNVIKVDTRTGEYVERVSN